MTSAETYHYRGKDSNEWVRETSRCESVGNDHMGNALTGFGEDKNQKYEATAEGGIQIRYLLFYECVGLCRYFVFNIRYITTCLNAN